MKTVEELRQYFDTTLGQDLQTLEAERIKIANATKFIILGGILGGILSLILFFITKITFLPIILAFVILFICFIIYSNVAKGYKSNFKESVIARIIKFIDSNFDYYPNKCISQEEYMYSELFKHKPDRYKGDDLVIGKIGETNFTFSELHSEYKTTDSKGRTQWHTIFKGLFFIANFNKKFKGKTFAIPDVAERMFGSVLGGLFQSWNKTRGELVKLEDAEFEKMFAVYGSDQIEARYILSTSLMRRIVEYKKKTNKSIHLAFIDNKIFIAIDYMKNLFEPRIFTSLLNFDVIAEYYDDMLIAISIVEDLNLNLRIWG